MNAPNRGRLIGVVGASGVGKDSLIDALCAVRPGIARVRRVITRPAGSAGEDHIPATSAAFAAMQRDGAFCLSWQAHGLGYGIPGEVPNRVAGGATLIVNLSRGVLAEAEARLGPCVFLNVTAPPEVLAARLQGRGRETPDQIAARVARRAVLPADLPIHEISNDTTLQAAVARALQVLDRDLAPAN